MRNAGFFLALALAPGACNPQCQPPPPAPAPVRYDVRTIATGLENPWDLTWTPTGTLLVTERTGDINAVGGSEVYRIGRPADVVNQGEGGMMGIAADPAFGTNGFIYTCYLTASDVRVVRFTVGAGFSSLGAPTPLITGLPRSSGRHSGCRVRIGPDGMLWVTTGDAAVGTNPQDPRSLGGKVLRVHTDGRIPTGNMAPPFRPEIYAYGFRNPQGITFRNDGTPFLIEHGPDRDDEITPLAPGGNGGWNPVGSGSYDERVPMTDLAEFPNALRPVWSSGNPTIAPSGGTFVNSDKWGTLAGSHIAMGVLKGSQVRLVNVTNGASAPIVQGQGRIRVAVEGPDGNLWVLTDANPGRILLVTPVR
jgi:glucose/arabinose dehydrogenase